MHIERRRHLSSGPITSRSMPGDPCSNRSSGPLALQYHFPAPARHYRCITHELDRISHPLLRMKQNRSSAPPGPIHPIAAR